MKGKQGLNGQTIRIQSKAQNNPFTGRRNHGMMTKILPTVHIADMHLHNRSGYRTDSILQRNGGVGISPSIQDDAVV